jgi:hypothetical protein
MRTEYGADSYATSWSADSRRPGHLADLEETCWLIAIGSSLTALVCALGYAESISQALAISG